MEFFRHDSRKNKLLHNFLMERKIINNSILIILVFLIGMYGRSIFDYFIPITISNAGLKILIPYLWWVLPSLLLLIFLYGYKTIPSTLGINKGLGTALIFSIITVLTMIISSAIIGKIDSNLNFEDLIHKTIVSGLLEEYFFRGFLFGILFRKLKWGFIPASIVGSLIFGLGHIYQGSTVLETTGVFFITAIGAIWFSWLYIEWDNNLWIPIFLHTLMNMSWILFDVSNNALGGGYTNLFRALTVALTIFITIKKNKKSEFTITRSNLFIKKK